MTNTQTLANQIGRAKMASALHVGATAISKYTMAEQFPAAWFTILERLCAENGIACPRELFSFKTDIPSNGPNLKPSFNKKVSCRASQVVNAKAEFQGQVAGGAS